VPPLVRLTDATRRRHPVSNRRHRRGDPAIGGRTSRPVSRILFPGASRRAVRRPSI